MLDKMYRLVTFFVYIFPKMCTCIITTIPNFRGTLCNKYNIVHLMTSIIGLICVW